MRVIAGSKRGAKLKAPEGMDTRPTLDRVKQSLFSMIQYEIKGARVLDLYAGSGGLGIEALSRGASYCDFVDRDRTACKIVQDNLIKTGFDSVATVHNVEAMSFLQRLTDKCDLVFLDPPYRKNLIIEPINLLISNDKLADNALLVIEHPFDEVVDLTNKSEVLELYKEKKYGGICVSIYRRKS